MTNALSRLRRRLPARALALGLCAWLPLAAAAQDRSGDRAARRAQLQMQALQQQLQAAQSAQARAETDKADADRKLAGHEKDLSQAQASARRAAEALKAADAERAQLKARLDSLEKQSADDRRQADAALAGRSAELDALARARDARQAQLQARFDDERRQLGACSARNERLVALGGELVDRYRNKGLAEVLRQRDPVLGLGDVQIFNYVQDARERLEAERIAPPPAPASEPQKPLP
jgi:colicin import membrane protein